MDVTTTLEATMSVTTNFEILMDFGICLILNLCFFGLE